MNSIAFIGGGQMATALIAGLLRDGTQAEGIVVVEPDPEQRKRLESRFAVRTIASATISLGPVDVAVWAVKPQVMRKATAPIAPILAGSLHISIVAGVATPSLVQWLGTDRVIRTMPNTPALVGSGVTAMLGAPGASKSDRALAEKLLAATGYTFWLDSDDRIDAVTALSGSGPGYVFEFLASFQQAAQAIGFSPEEARELVLRTARGAVDQAACDDTAFTALRDRVASRGGTTEAGLEALGRNHFSRALFEAVASAYQRARRLSAVLSA